VTGPSFTSATAIRRAEETSLDRYTPVCETLAKSHVKRRCLLRWSALTRELKTRLLAAGGVLEVADNTVAASSRSRDAVAE
jgi:hypothetical protein